MELDTRLIGLQVRITSSHVSQHIRSIPASLMETTSMPATIMTETQASAHGVFDFFGLPAELRNAIYEQDALAEVHRQKLSGHDNGQFVAFVMRRPSLNLLLVSRELSAGYLDRQARLDKFVVIDHCEYQGGELRELPKLALSTASLEARLLIDCYHSSKDHPCCGVNELVNMHKRWLSRLAAELGKLRSITIKLYMQHSAGAPTFFHNLLARMDSLSSIEKTESVEIRLGRDLEELQTPNTPSVKVAAWTAARDTVETYPERLSIYDQNSDENTDRLRAVTAEDFDNETDYDLEDLL